MSNASKSQDFRELICTIGSKLTFFNTEPLHQAIHNPQTPLHKLTIHCGHKVLTEEEIALLQELYEQCCDCQVELQIKTTSLQTFRALIHHSLFWLDITTLD